ncbi:MFS transporter [Micromonospora sp. M12]
MGTSLAYLLLAAPLGVLADRIGRLPVVIGGYTALGVTYLLLAGPVDGWPLIALTLTLYGGFYAATDGVLIALAGPVLPARLRTTGIALVQTGQALAYLVSSVLFGLAWQAWGRRTRSARRPWPSLASWSARCSCWPHRPVRPPGRCPDDRDVDPSEARRGDRLGRAAGQRGGRLRGHGRRA